jgi:hypothetical protein
VEGKGREEKGRGEKGEGENHVLTCHLDLRFLLIISSPWSLSFTEQVLNLSS